MDEFRYVDRSDPEEVFSLLSNESRVAILRALWDAEDPLRFSDLRESVGMRDSGQFNYHLDELVGSFVRRTDEGYELTQAGMRINGAIETGAYTTDVAFDPLPLSDPCRTCGGQLTLDYEDETVRIECDSCELTMAVGVPPSVFAGRDREDVPSVASQYLRTRFQQMDSGFCPFCEGRVEPTVGPLRRIIDLPDEPPERFPDELVEQLPDLPMVRYDCQRCGQSPTSGLGLVFHDHPAVTSFYHERGIDVRTTPIWRFVAMNTDHERVRSRDPFRASVSYRVDDDELTVVVDEDLQVVEVERTAGTA
ncbi:hypothetical protein BRD00_13030 [Halobacteriales archaeon QS_8_69_26]|nr:MAG: hypothetical protein BRD00_13030 [Halobacteriales archaeon QS_8_69_26]